MPAAVLVVHDEPDTRELAVTALRAAFLDVIGFDDPMAALNAIEDDTRVRVLVTRVAFGPGKLNGVALARMVRVKRPGTKLFSSLARKMHATRRVSGCSYRSRLILTLSSRRLPVCWPRETDLHARCRQGRRWPKRGPLTHGSARLTPDNDAHGVVEPTACKAANRKTPISSGNRNSATFSPISPPSEPMIAPPAQAAKGYVRLRVAGLPTLCDQSASITRICRQMPRPPGRC